MCRLDRDKLLVDVFLDDDQFLDVHIISKRISQRLEELKNSQLLRIFKRIKVFELVIYCMQRLLIGMNWTEKRLLSYICIQLEVSYRLTIVNRGDPSINYGLT